MARTRPAGVSPPTPSAPEESSAKHCWGEGWGWGYEVRVRARVSRVRARVRVRVRV
jgi:hypothetical protein